MDKLFRPREDENGVKLPPYYRVSTATFERLKTLLSTRRPGDISDWQLIDRFNGLEIFVDDSVPDGDALPPIGWGE